MTTTTPQIAMILISKLSISPLNGRKEIDEIKLLELTASVKEKGIQHPITVRPTTSGEDWFEIIAGQRRFKAAQRCGLTEMPAIVKVMSDEEAIEYSLIDNTQREDLDPLDEAAEYVRLMKISKGITIEKIASQISKPRSYVAKRLKLNSLIDSGKNALRSKKIFLGQALLIAPLNEADQKVALKACLDGYTVENENDLVQWIENNIMLSLSAAPWPKKEEFATKIQSVACTVCPKRTGADPDLFGDSKNDRCFDASCYRAKMESFLYMKREELKLRSERFVQISTEYNGKGKDVMGRNYYTTPSKGCENAITGLIVEGEGIGHTKRICLEPKCKACRPSYSSSSDNSYRKREAAERKKANRELKIRNVIFKAVYNSKLKIDQTKLDAIGEHMVDVLDFDSSKRICDALGIEAPKGGYGGRDYRKALMKHYQINKRKTMLMVIYADALNTRHYDSTKELNKLLKLAKDQKIDAGKIRKQINEQFDKKKKPAKVKSSRKKQSIHKCEFCGCTEKHACPGGCSWDPEFLAQKRYVCSNCVRKVKITSPLKRKAAGKSLKDLTTKKKPARKSKPTKKKK